MQVLKNYVLKILKCIMSGSAWMSTGRLFQTTGSA